MKLKEPTWDMKAAPFKNPVCVALDVDSDSAALELVETLSEVVGGFKLGPRLLLKYPGLLKRISKSAPTFVDCKFFDIPSTMVSAVQAAFDEGASLVTVHGLSGAQALKELSQLEARLSQIRPFKILAVSILTSWDEQSFPSNFKNQKVMDHVSEIASSVSTSGLKSLVCSGEELKILKEKFPDFYFVVPGVRWDLEDHQDQKRVVTPRKALESGASLLVIGRPIIQAQSPLEASLDCLASLV